MIRKDRVVIGAHAGGLGDNLLYSTLPELFARDGHEVFISTQTPFRNEEIPELVWRHNPFVAGFTNDTPNAGADIFLGNDIIREAQQHTSAIEAVEFLNGYKPTNFYPRIYYKPKFRKEFINSFAIDPASISQSIPQGALLQAIHWVKRWHGLRGCEEVWLQSKHSGSLGSGYAGAGQELAVSSIFEYVDIIYSSKAFFGTQSGGQVLASAIRGSNAFPKVFGLQTTMAYNDRLFIFPNVKTYVTGKVTEDYHFYEEERHG